MNNSLRMRDLVGTAGRADIDDMVAAERALHARDVAISAPNTAHATSPVVAHDDVPCECCDEPFAEDESDGGDDDEMTRQHGVWMRRWAKARAAGDRAAILITWYAPQVIR